MKGKRMSRAELDELMARMEARIARLREIETRGRAELEARRRAAEERRPRRQRLFRFL